MEKNTKKKFTKKAIAVLIAALVLIAAGAVGAFAVTGASPSIKSDDYTAEFYMDHLQVHLLENGKDVCGGQNTLDGTSKIKGDFVQYLGYKDGVLGSVEPGMLYKETLAARNAQDFPIYVRMTVRKYWVKVNKEDGTAGDKTTVLAPKYIRLTYGDEDYNKDEWTLDKSVSTEESKTYYCKKAVEPNGDSAELFDQLIIDNKLTERSEDKVIPPGDNGVTTIKYVYKYDGCAFMIEADVQAIQTHNANEAIESQWGVKNVKAENGTLTVK